MKEKEELLEKYFLEGLSEIETKTLEKWLEENAGFKEQFEFEKEVRETIQIKEREALKSKLTHLETEIERKSFPWKFVGVAASIALVLGFVTYFFTVDNTPNAEQLYATHYKTYPNTVYAITRGNEADTEERKAFVAYEANKHSEAILLFEAIRKQESKAYIDFYLAQSYLKTGNTAKAKLLFEAKSQDAEQFNEEALWYLGLTYLAENDVENAKLVLKKLINERGYKQQEAIELLKKLS